MKLHTCFITHDRLDLTKRAIESYFDTVTVPFSVIVVDNASTDGTAEWLEEQALAKIFDACLIPENRYPGYACNRGWESAPADADFLHRADNDFIFLPGWCDWVGRAFGDPRVGQVGLRTNQEEQIGGRPAPYNVGGNNVIRRELWDKGLRYDERPWREYPPGYSEDSFFSPAVEQMGWRWIRVRRPCIQPISVEDPADPYYQKSWGDRRIYSSAT